MNITTLADYETAKANGLINKNYHPSIKFTCDVCHKDRVSNYKAIKTSLSQYNKIICNWCSGTLKKREKNFETDLLYKNICQNNINKAQYPVELFVNYNKLPIPWNQKIKCHCIDCGKLKVITYISYKRCNYITRCNSCKTKLLYKQHPEIIQKIKSNKLNKTKEEKQIIAEKRKNTLEKRFGKGSAYSYLGGAGHYVYEGVGFDSKPELQFYIYCKHLNYDIHRNEIGYTYIDEVTNKTKMYYPDFVVNNKIYEIKGSHLINDQYQLIDYFGDKHIEVNKTNLCKSIGVNFMIPKKSKFLLDAENFCNTNHIDLSVYKVMGANNYSISCKKVKCIMSGKIYNSAKEAALDNHVSYGTMIYRLKHNLDKYKYIINS